MTDEGPANDLARRDEMLQLLYWIEGERFTAASKAGALARFLTWDASLVHEVLTTLVRRGEVAADALGEYHLTEQGREEAGRRFADEFASMTKPGHGECNDPDCDCHTDPAAAAVCQATRTNAQ